jgi:transposase-like protein
MDLNIKLKSYQEKILKRLLGQFEMLNETDISEFTPRSTMLCRQCRGSSFVKNGLHKGRQRYKCKDCGSTQFSDANTVMYNIKLKDKWIDFVYIMLDKEQPKSCRKIGVLLEIDYKTAHHWRHKFLTALKEVEQLSISNEVELDEIYLPFCVKGRIGKEKYDEWYGEGDPRNVESALRKEEKVKEQEKHQAIFLCAHNRNSDFDFTPIKIQKKGIVSEDDLKSVCIMDLTGKTVITDSDPSIKCFLRNYRGINHQTFKSSDVKQGIMVEEKIHNNNINNTMMRLKKWLRNFFGVSTKYISLYLKWFRFENISPIYTIKQLVMINLLDKQTYSNYKNIFSKYTDFVYV